MLRRLARALRGGKRRREKKEVEVEMVLQRHSFMYSLSKLFSLSLSLSPSPPLMRSNSFAALGSADAGASPSSTAAPLEKRSLQRRHLRLADDAAREQRRRQQRTAAAAAAARGAIKPKTTFSMPPR